MAITKTGRVWLRDQYRNFEKRSSLAGVGEAADIALAAHIAQNMVVRGLIEHPERTKDFVPKLLMRGVLKPGSPMPDRVTGSFYGAGKGVIPEIGALYEEAGNLGNVARKNMTRLGIDPDQLTRRDLVAVRKMLRGDFKDAYNLNTPNAKKLVRVGLETLLPDTKDIFKNVESVRGAVTGLRDMAQQKPYELIGAAKNGLTNLVKQHSGENRQLSRAKAVLDEAVESITPEQMDTFLGELGQVVKTNRLTGPLTRVFGKSKKQRELQDWALNTDGTKESTHSLENIADVLGSGGLMWKEPVAEGVNLLKRVASSGDVQKVKYLNTVQDNLADAFTGVPMRNRFRDGLAGKKIKSLSDFIGTNVVNPVTTSLEHLANGVGLAAHKAGINPENFKELGSVVNDMKGNKPPTAYRRIYDKLTAKPQPLPAKMPSLDEPPDLYSIAFEPSGRGSILNSRI